MFGKTNVTDKPLDGFIREKESRQISNSRNKGKGTTAEPLAIKKIRRKFYGLHANELDNLDEMDKLLERHK